MPMLERALRLSFDPVHVGYVTEASEGSYLVDTSIEGNRNTGHAYADDLSEEDRWALLEFLKTL